MPKHKPANKRPRPADNADSSADLSMQVGETVREYFDNLIRSIQTDFVDKFKKMRDEFVERENNLTTKQDKLEKELEKATLLNAKLLEETNELKDLTQNMRQRLCDNEQQTRKASIKIYGLKEINRNESVLDTTHLVLEFLNVKMGVRVGIQDICTSHRLGKPEPHRYRSVIVKFARRLTKFEVLENRFRLKGSGIVVAEDLSPANTRLFWEMRDTFGQRNVWTRDCKIYVNTREGIRQVNQTNRLETLGLSRHDPHASTPARRTDQRPRPQQGRHEQRGQHVPQGARQGPADRRPTSPPVRGRGRASPRGSRARAFQQQPTPPGVEPMGAWAFGPPPPNLRGFARGHPRGRYDDA